MVVATGAGVTIKQIVAAVLLCCSTLATAAELSLIIDDVGYRHTDHRVLNLPPGTTLSVLPHTPWGRQLAVSGWRQGHEIMLHLPMLAEAGNALGPSALLPGMSQWQVQLTIKRALADVPFVRGVNNHMGSELTQQRPMMDKVMTELAERKLFFVDSLTTPESVAYDSAAAHGIPALKRHVFLDNETQDVDLNRQFEQALTIAQKYGKAVLIGHPYPETLSYLERNLSRLPEMGIRLVPTSTLLSNRQRQWMRPVQPPTAYLHKLPAPVPSASP